MSISRTFRAMSAVAVVGSAVAAVTMTAPAAQAAVQECYENSKTFDLPHKPDVTVRINLCVERDGGTVRAKAHSTWAGTAQFIGGTRFNDFDLEVRLERYDVIKASRVVDLKSRINSYNVASANNTPVFSLQDRPAGGWSTDGVVTFDIADDGLGDQYWNLHGSPVIS